METLIGEFAEIEDNTELIAAVEAHVEAVEQVLAEQARRDGLDLPDFPPDAADVILDTVRRCRSPGS